ncbi:MAG: helix-turn-helix domain-containing protein [Spirochaetaceae bacterium]
MNRERRLFFRYTANNVLILLLPLLVAMVYYAVSIGTLRDRVDTFVEAQLQQSIDFIDREFWELGRMAAQIGNDYEVNNYLSNDGEFSDLEYYNLRNLSDKLSPYAVGSPMIRNVVLYLHRSQTLVSDSGFGYFDDYYDTVISIEGYSARQWRSTFLASLQRTAFYPSVTVDFYGDRFEAHLYRSNIGYGAYYLGTLLSVISSDDLRGMLAQTPQEYGGWVQVSTGDGHAIVTAPADATGEFDHTTDDEKQRTVLIDGERYRLYHMTSPVNGWQYTAALNEALVFSEVMLIRTIALGLFAVALAVGLVVAYAVAFRTSKPLSRLLQIVEDEDVPGNRRKRSVYEELEAAIDTLTDSTAHANADGGSAGRVARTYFYQNVLRGAYRSRSEFDRDCEAFGISFAGASYYVIVARIVPLNVVRGGEAYTHVRDELIAAMEDTLGADDLLVPTSFDDTVLVCAVPHDTDLRVDAEARINSIRGAIEPGLRGDYYFGLGTAVDDPFTLTISYNQAIAAASTGASHGGELLQSYSNDAGSLAFYSYPLDLEEGLMRAVRSGNRDLVSKLVASVRSENFEQRHLSDAEMDDLFVELKGTALKLYSSLPGDEAGPDPEFQRWWELPASDEKVSRFERLCVGLSERFDRHKRSHNTVLLSAIQQHIREHFADPGLGLTSIAESFNRSENYLSSFYKEQTGIRLSDALLEIRMERARALLSQGFDVIDRVALECGYTNATSFRRAFKRVYGVSPSEFRGQTGP